MEIQVTRSIKLPDPLKLARYRHRPDLGPKILFFSGGSALKDACPELIRYTHNSIHIITPFDSGGSSAKIRDAFAMPAIGDVRNRLLALADRSLHGYPEIHRLFAHRFPTDGDPEKLTYELNRMIRGEHELVADIPDPMRKIIRHHLDLFRNYMPEDFDLHKASIGNLILTAGYLDNRRNFDIIIFIFSKLVQVRGVVRPVVNRDLHMVTELENGDLIIGQHSLTGKEKPPISSKVMRIYICEHRDHPRPAETAIREKMQELIRDADVICYPMGSFYSSLIANLLPRGIGDAIRRNPCPKVFIPNTDTADPEAYGMSLSDQVRTLISYLRRDDPDGISAREVLDFILIDSENGRYPGSLFGDSLSRMGIEVIDTPLVSPEKQPFIDEKLLVPILLSLA
ncbi:MAG: GAK system CofD-like protein [Desulfococcaceae bacterium]